MLVSAPQRPTTQWHLIKAYQLHFLSKFQIYYAFYLTYSQHLFTEKKKKKAFLKWNVSLFFLPQKLFIEREIKLFNNFLVLRVMTTAKRSNDLFSTLFWMAPLWESSSRTEPKQSPSSETVTLWQLHRFHSVSAVSVLFHNCDMFIIWKLSLPTLLVIMPSSVFDKKPAWAAPIADLVKQDFSVNSFWTTQELINEGSSLWPSGLMPACETSWDLGPFATGLTPGQKSPQSTK